ncbi:MAG: CoA transferase [Alphaproteobacteria bacterium]|nr:CoA transferase [Alphaproteobacteria bacterium]
MPEAQAQTFAALGRFRVLDLTRVRSGPTCVRVLADFGADVIRIESPAGLDPTQGTLGARDSSDALNLHRNKRSITLNLKEPQAQRIFHRLVQTADVVVENYRPDVKQRLGIDYDALSSINPRIVLASISGFGQDGPYQKRPGFDQIAQGMGGLMSVTGFEGQGPVRAGIAVADTGSGLYSAIGILTALLEREQSGRGQWVQANLLSTMIAMCDFQAARYLIDGVVPPQAGNDHPVTTPMGAYPSSDGYFNIGAGSTQQFRTLCDLIDRPDLREHPDYQTSAGRLKDRATLNRILSESFAQRPTAHWVEALNAAGVPCGPIYNMQQVFDDPQVQHLPTTTTLHHPRRGPIRVLNQPLILSRTPAQVKQTQCEAGEHNQSILSELGYNSQDIEQFIQQKVI